MLKQETQKLPAEAPLLKTLPEPRRTQMRMLSKREIVARTSLSPATIWRRIKAGDFPKPRQLTPNRIGWPESLIEEWENSRPEGQYEQPDNLKTIE